MNKNYQLELDKVLADIEKENIRPRLLLQACCGPCSSYVLEYLTQYFDITLLFYNPNIQPRAEYDLRYAQLRRLVAEMAPRGVKILDCDYDESAFTDISRGYESEPEGGARCTRCFTLRLTKTAQTAQSGGYDCFGTTLTISPHKNAQLINAIGEKLASDYGVKWLPADFKKREGYKRSLELSRQYGLYRQDYCGCLYSKIE